jgi:hypothetical protein
MVKPRIRSKSTTTQQSIGLFRQLDKKLDAAMTPDYYCGVVENNEICANILNRNFDCILHGTQGPVVDFGFLIKRLFARMAALDNKMTEINSRIPR